MNHWLPAVLLAVFVLSLPFLLSGGVPQIDLAASQPSGVKEPASPADDTTPAPDPGFNPAGNTDQAPQPPSPAPPKGQKVAYLTFDDGPNSHFTEPILDILKKHNVVATFFIVGENAALHPHLIERILTEGHAVGNHSYSHVYKSIYASPQALINELDRCNQVLEPFTGHPVKVFRAPGGPSRLTAAMKASLAEKGYTSIGWNMTGKDSEPAGITPEILLQTVIEDLDRVERLNRTPILLLHDGTQLHSLDVKEGTPAARYIQNRNSVINALPDVIKLFHDRGYTFIHADENTPPAW
ncbi:MAG: polysaccharide deacetylase family protein [Bacillota bacterium]